MANLDEVLAILGAGNPNSGNSAALALMAQGERGASNSPRPQAGSGGLSAPGVIAPKHAPRQQSFSERFLEAFKTGMDINATNQQLALQSRRLDMDTEAAKIRAAMDQRAADREDAKFDETKRSNRASESIQRTEEEGRNARLEFEQGRLDERARLDREISRMRARAAQAQARVAQGGLNLERQKANEERGRRAQLQADRLDFLSAAADAGTIPEGTNIEALARDDDAYKTFMDNVAFPKPSSMARPVAVKGPDGKPILVTREDSIGQEPATTPPYESTTSQMLARRGVELLTKIEDQAISSTKSDDEMAELERLFEGAYTGLGGEVVLNAEKFASALGLDLGIGDASTVGPREAGVALSKAMALRLRDPSQGAGLPGQMSDQDRRYLDSMVGGIGMTGSGRQFLFAVHRRQNDRKRVILEMANEYLQNNDSLDNGFVMQMVKYANENPIITDDLKELHDAAEDEVENTPTIRETNETEIGGIPFGASGG